MIFLRIALALALAACALASHAQIAFRASTSASVGAPSTIAFGGSGGTATRNGCGSITPGLPGGTSAGDLLLAVIATADDSTITMAGWNSLFNASGATNEGAALFWRIATGGDPRTITQSGTCNVMIARIARFTGVDPVAPIDSVGASYQNASTVTSGSVAIGYSGAMTVVTAHTNDNSSFGGLAGFTQAFNVNTTTGNDAAIALYYDSPTGTPPFTAGPYTVSKTRGADPNHGVLFSLRPAGSRLTLAVPAGTALDDVMIAALTVRPCSSASGGACTVSLTAPAGWTLVSNVDQPTGAGTGGFGNSLFIYQRVATAAEPTSYTWNIDGTPVHAGAAGAILGFSGVDTANPIVAQAGQATPSAFTHDAPSVDTTGVQNAMLVTAFSDNSSATWTPPGGMTEQVDIASLAVPDTLGLSLEIDTEALASAGPTGTRTATQSNPPTQDTGATYSLALRPAVNLAHYAIAVVSSTVANCDYAQVTISGHDASHNLVAPPAGRSLAISTSAGTGVWQGPGTVAGTGAWTPSGANNGTATYVWPGGEKSFTVRLRQSAVTSLNINLNDGSVVEDPLEDPTINFVNSAFRISDGASASLAIGTQIAGKPSSTGFAAQNLFLQAVRTDTSTGSCVSLYSSGSDVAIDVGAQCNNPASCTRSVTLTSSAASGNTALVVPNGAYPATMNFRFTTANAEAPFSLNYADAGQITLQFRAPLPSPPSGQYVQGTSNAFVVRPFALSFSGMQHANSASGTWFKAAGDNFTMALTARQWASGQDANNDGVPDSTANISGNGTTPNYAATATVAATSNPAGAAGAVSRGATCASAASIALSGGTATANDWCYSEVGNVLLTATAANYLGSGQDVTGTSGLDGDANGPYVGRFSPKKFVLVGSPSLTPRSDLACAGSAFTYMDETLKLAFKVEARNTQDAVTTNYSTAGGYAKVNSVAAWGFGARSGATNLTARIDTSGTLGGSWMSGVADMTFNTAILRLDPVVDGPFQALRFGIAPNDGEASMGTLDLDVDNAGGNDHKDLGLVADVRFGRMRLDNMLGSEARQLPVPLRVEYWNGSGFATNADDSCTSVPKSAIALDFTPVSNLNACETMVNSGSLTFSAGVAPLVLAAPGVGNSGSVVLAVNLSGASGNYCNAIGAASVPTVASPTPLPYLRGRWNDGVDGDAVPATLYDDNPSARAAFGIYGSQPGNFIYFRERFD